MSEFVDLDMALIFCDNDFNCRGDSITPGSVIELASEIEKSSIGLIHPITVQPWTSTDRLYAKYKYRILTGHRRYQACRTLGWKVIPARICEGLTETQARVINLKENLARLDLNMLQEARAIDEMYSRGMTASEIAKSLDMGSKWVKDRLDLLQLPEDVQHEAAAGIIKAAHIAELKALYLKDPNKMYEGVRSIKNANGRKIIKVKPVRPQGPTTTREFRNMSDVFKMQDTCTDALGSNLASRAIAWVIGEISAIDLLNDIKYETGLMGMPWSIPQSYIDADKLEKKQMANDMTTTVVEEIVEIQQ